MTDRVFSGASLEDRYGYCRAIRIGDRIEVAGTAPIWPDDTCDPDPGVQARRCIEIIETALTELGAGLGDVVRTRMLITDREYEPAVGAAHGEAFGQVRPVSTMVVVAGLLDPRWKVEIEAVAVTGP